MAKQLIIAAVEEVFGEYILNMSKDNLKIAALRGKIKLENVQLDGELIGSHILGAIGLHQMQGGASLAILSCSARSIKVSVPWKSLEKEPTRIEVRGVHLVCVPLLPSTANKLYGDANRNSSSSNNMKSILDPQCSLRTRAKRHLLARLERNFWNGQLPNEGPPMKQVQRAVREVERDIKSRRKAAAAAAAAASNSKNKSSISSTSSTSSFSLEDLEAEEAIDNLIFGGNNCDDNINEEKSSKDAASSSYFSTDDLPQIPRDWKVKLREKVMRNLEATMHDVHIRCEVSEKEVGVVDSILFGATAAADGGGADGGGSSLAQEETNSTTTTATTKEGETTLPAEERAFAFGFTLESLVVRTASENWEVGSHDRRNPVDGSAMSSVKGHLGPNEYMVKNNKIGYFNKLSMYWDDAPPMLLADTDVLRGNYRKLSPEKLQSRIAAAMDAMFHKQEPGKAVRQSLSVPVPSHMDLEQTHQYICNSLHAEVRVRTSDRFQPGPISGSADVLPFDWSFRLLPHQYLQYQMLQVGIKSQQRFDTMLRQRPTDSPRKNPRAWWQYAIECVTSRPNSRPWEDVKKIARSRRRYMDLVNKKNKARGEGSGYHAGLSENESSELLELEDLLPIEALTAFHLLALRQVYESEKQPDVAAEEEKTRPKPPPSSPEQPHKSRSKGLGLFRLSSSRKRSSAQSGSGGGESEPLMGATWDIYSDDDVVKKSMVQKITSRKSNAPPRPPDPVVDENILASEVTLLEAMTLRLGKKVWLIDWKLHDATIDLSVLQSYEEPAIAQLVIRARGDVRSFGKGKRDFWFDITQCDVLHREAKVLFVRPAEEDRLTEDEDDESVMTAFDPFHERSSLRRPGSQKLSGPDLLSSARFLDLPPGGVVCRIVAGMNASTKNFSISSHPATLIWTTSLFDGMSDFFFTRSENIQADLTQHIRNAATPLARKAQLALLSPASMALHLNIVAPKIWLPIAVKGPEGTLLLDAGVVRVASRKNEGETEMTWNVRGRDFQANFCRGRPISLFKQADHTSLMPPLGEAAARAESAIIRPFHVSVDASTRPIPSKYDESSFLPEGGLVRDVGIHISPVCLNLVDAEVLARAFGKWYARSLHRVRRRVSFGRDGKNSRSLNTVHQDVNASKEADNIDQGTVPQRLSVRVEKVEMALEGHSKRPSDGDDRSMASQDSFHEASPPIRTYLVELHAIEVLRTSRDRTAATSLSVLDASIVRLKDGSLYTPFKNCREATDSEYCILVRSNPLPGPTELDQKNGFPPTDDRPRIIRTSLLHDGSKHLDEVEIDIDSVVLRVTPTTLKDCAKAVKRIAELAQLATKEMERKVHEEGRKARKRDRKPVIRGRLLESPTGSLERPGSPSTSYFTEVPHERQPSQDPPLDSSILFRVTMKESTILAGRPAASLLKPPFQRDHTKSFAVIQILSNALIMFQSIENPDGTGAKTLHVSIDRASALVNTEFERVPPSEAPPMIGPTGAEFRVVYATENLGCVVSQDLSLDCEALKVCLTPNDLSIMINISKIFVERMRAFSHSPGSGGSSRPDKARFFSSLIRYQKKGTGIATGVRVEIQTISFILLRAYKTYLGSPEFLEFLVKGMKGRLGGCMSALSGECNSVLSVNFFNSDAAGWEYAIEPFPLTIEIDQMPNELVLDFSSEKTIQLNLTGILLRDFAELKFDFKQDHSTVVADSLLYPALNPSVLSTVGLRRAIEAPSIRLKNLTGFDIHVVPDSTGFVAESGLVHDGSTKIIDSIPTTTSGGNKWDEVSFCLRIGDSAIEQIGEREPVYDLPIAPASAQSPRLYLLRSAKQTDISQPGFAQLNRLLEGRASPETIFTYGSTLGGSTFGSGLTIDQRNKLLNAEPVVEWCMHNQRLRSTVADIYSLNKGRDLLSSSVWSPEDEINEDTMQFSDSGQVQEGMIDSIGSPGRRQADSPRRGGKTSASRPSTHKSNWSRPYLKNDSPEWTDMTCTLRMARERVMLPDNNWMWVNDWTVDLSGKLGCTTDSDGWEYQADFETFSRTSRYYERGDVCRRRRWTRTRIVKPPPLNDPNRLLRFVWDTSKDEHGNVCVEVRSNLRILNSTASSLSFFLFSPSWREDKFAGLGEPGSWVNVPVSLASAVYLRIAKTTGGVRPSSVTDCICTERLTIVPTSHTSSTYVRTSISLGDVSGTTLHFLVEIRSKKGIVDIIVEPVLRVINLLPCQLECQLGEALRSGGTRIIDSRTTVGDSGRKISMTETMKIASGKDAAFTAVSPWRKPHISMRVPGYKWSHWHRIVNRKATLDTWRPPESEEDWCFNSKDDAESADEFKSIIHFQRSSNIGDQLLVIMSVECSHSPILRIYSQYWILDKTGFGCRFTEGFEDLMGTVPDNETSRRSYLKRDEAKYAAMRSDMSIPGHQWSIGKGGMTMFFSKREKLAFSIETSVGTGPDLKSKWIAPLDISNVMPKTVISVDEQSGTRCFELAVSVTVCPGIFSRTRLISLLPRYQIINLLHRELVVAQDGCLDAVTIIPSQSSVPFHWEHGSLPPKVRLGAPSADEKHSGRYSDCWTNGRVRLDRIGITAMRLPTENNLAKIPMVVQTEVRLATKEQSSAVVVVIWSANEKTNNPLYIIRNRTHHTILCRQPLQEEELEAGNGEGGPLVVETCTGRGPTSFQCGADIGPMILSFLGLDRFEEFVWVLKSGDVACFGFDDPEKPHILEWTCVSTGAAQFDDKCKKAFLEVDAMGSTSILSMSGGHDVKCQICAEHSTKVIEFTAIGSSNRTQPTGFAADEALNSLRMRGMEYQEVLKSEGLLMDHIEVVDEDEDAAFGVRVDLPGLSISVIDNADRTQHGREILLAQLEKLSFAFSQTREGYHEFELRLMSLQVDNHVHKSIHPVLIHCPSIHANEPLLHMSAVRRLQLHSNTFVFRYAAIRVLEIDVFLDRRTAETIATFIEPLTTIKESENEEPPDWVSKLTESMCRDFASPDRQAPREIERTIHNANSGRIYFEQLHLHPVRLGLTFTQEWMEWNPGAEAMMVFQFIRGMASIANAPLTFTSFVVSHVFEAPQALGRVVATHYSSQLTKQIFGILGSLAILGAPADFITNVGTGVRDFFYEPAAGLVHGPKQFLEGLETGTQSLARGVFVGVVRGAANVTELVNANLVGLTADEEFIDERKAHQRLITDAMSRSSTRTFGDSLYLAGASVARGVRSGALGIVEQPAIYASKHGPVGFVKGVGKAIVGAIVKPVVGVGDAAVLVMNHMSDATSKKQVPPRIPKRLRRALPCWLPEKPNCVLLLPYDERAAKAQKIVTGGESIDDVYIGHIHIPSHLIIASVQCLWAIDRRSREPWCTSWEELSHFSLTEGGVRVVVFSQTGLKTYVFHVDHPCQATDLFKLLSMHTEKMGNSSELNSSLLSAEPESLSRHQIPGVKGRQVNHIFGSCNTTRHRLESSVKDEIDLVEQCFARVKCMGSESPTFFRTLDEETWSLITSWGQVFSGLSSKRCIVAGIINGTGLSLQIKSTKLMEGGSPCYTIPTKEFDAEQGILHAGGCVIFFGWGVVPNLLQAGNVFMHIETNGFICDLADQKSRDTYAEAMPSYQVGFLEKSYDESGWWAKYWLLVRSKA